MRHRLIMLICLLGLIFTGTALAQSLPGSIGVFSDSYPADCNFTDAGGLVQVFIFHVNTNGATAAQFKLDVENTAWTFLSEIWPFPHIVGRSIDGVSYGYGSCWSGPIQLATVYFFGSYAEPCTYIGIVPDPDAPSGKIVAIDCGDPFVKMFPTGGQGIVNPLPECTCNIPVEETSWGGVKALYR